MKNEANLIREELKKLNISNKQVSVRSDYNSVNLSIKDISIDAKQIEEIAKKYEKVHYCEITQEILSGGNSFVFVSYDWKVERDIKESKEFAELKEKVLPKLNEIEGNYGVEIAKGFWVFKNWNGSYRIGEDFYEGGLNFHNAEEVVFRLYKAIKQNKVQ